MGDHEDVENSIIYDGDANLTLPLRSLNEPNNFTIEALDEILVLMDAHNDFRLHDYLRRWLRQNVSGPTDSDEEEDEDNNEVRMRGNYDKIKTIRKSPRNAFSGAFSKLVKAPDTEYTCLICHTDKSDEVPDPTKILMTSCGHLFHRFCIKEWVKNASTEPTGHNRCPACRTEIVGFHEPESTLNS